LRSSIGIRVGPLTLTQQPCEKIMASFENVEIDQGCSFTRPPLFCNLTLLIGKKTYANFYQRPWLCSLRITSKRDFIATMKTDGKELPKSKSEFTTEETERVAKNYISLNI